MIEIQEWKEENAWRRKEVGEETSKTLVLHCQSSSNSNRGNSLSDTDAEWSVSTWIILEKNK